MEQQMQTFRFASREEYICALDKVMPSEFVEKRSIPDQGDMEYLPIAIQEAIADDIFQYWNVTSENYLVIANELIATVTITYMPSYPDAVEMYCTGSAAGAIQMDKNSKISDFPANKKTNALEYCLPARRAAAVGCALNSLGNIFGRNLGRKISNTKKLSPNFAIRVHNNVQSK